MKATGKTGLIWLPGLLVALVLFPCMMNGQGIPEYSGPIQGATTLQTAKIWLMPKDALEIEVELEGKVQKLSLAGRKNWKGWVPVTLTFEGLEADREYSAVLRIDGQEVPERIVFRTLGPVSGETWSFMLGSCTLYGIGASRLIRPGSFTKIFDVMREVPTEFMLWLGDNVYMLNGEWNSESRMYEKYTKVRLHEPINAFMRSRINYAVRDDHDYGPDNADGTFANKDATTECFRDFWPNPYFGNDLAPGVFSNFQYEDAEFFLLDGRYFKIQDGYTQIIGPGQMEWLKARLLESRSAFKFVALGSQVISEVNQHESWSYFDERQVLFDFIRENRIAGVIFLSGDRHFTELERWQQPGWYPLYGLTCSPLTSILRKTPLRVNDPEHNNPLRVPGTLVCEHNFGKITVEGPADDRKCKMEIFDAKGGRLWEYVIPASELQFD